MTEKEYLAQYDITNFDRPSLTTDMVLFTLDRTRSNIKKIDISGLQVLLIQRNNHPELGKWALPGGFCRPTESVLETAHRELQEETGIDTNLHLINTYSDQNRDPRGWIISNAYYGFVHKEDCKLRADTDAWKAEWFTITNHHTQIMLDQPNHKKITHMLCLENATQVLVSYVTEEQYITGYQITRTFTETLSDFAFDHGKIILETFLQVQNMVKNDIRIVFDTLPETFTIGELQKAYECLLETPVINFRRIIKDFVIETDQTIKAGYRPAKLYKRNFDVFLNA